MKSDSHKNVQPITIIMHAPSINIIKTCNIFYYVSMNHKNCISSVIIYTLLILNKK